MAQASGDSMTKFPHDGVAFREVDNALRQPQAFDRLTGFPIG
jgi:hypothetical protein